MYCSSIVSRVHNVFTQIHPVSKISVADAGGYHVFNIYSRVISGSTWSGLVCTPSCRAPFWFPLVPSEKGIWASSPETDQDSCQGWVSPVPLDLVFPREGFSPGPLTLRFKRFPTTSNLPINFLCVFCVVYSEEPLCETIRRSGDFINDLPSPQASLFRAN